MAAVEFDRRSQRGNQSRARSSQGSGFFISEDGYLVTNNHVVESGPTSPSSWTTATSSTPS